MNIAVIGGNGRTGRIVVKAALGRGHKVAAVTRTDEASEPDDDNRTNARADVRSPGALKQALVGADAVIHVGRRNVALVALPAIFTLARRNELPDAVAKNTISERHPASPPPVDP